MNGNLTVNAGSYRAYNFTVPSWNHISSEVAGFFNVSGENQKIKVYVMNSANFTEWQNQHDATMYHNSGKLNNGYFEVFLPNSGGDYDLVFDNTFSSSPKNVTASFSFDFLGT